VNESLKAFADKRSSQQKLSKEASFVVHQRKAATYDNRKKWQ